MPVTLQRRAVKNLDKKRAKELEARHSKYYRGDRNIPALIQCRRSEVNHFRGQVYNPFKKLPMASEHWMSRSTIGAKICIKYRKHWKSYVSFQLSGQIGLAWQSEIIHKWYWHKLYHKRPMTIFKLIFKKLPKSEKVGLPRFQTIKECWFLSMIKKTHGFESYN